MNITTRVCIIGAGISGLKTAHTLLTTPKTSFKSEDVVIVEAQDRVGGRIKTDTTSSKIGATYDLGAAWFHDALTNSVLRDSINNGSFQPETDGYFDDKATAYYAMEVEGKIDAENFKLEQIIDDIETFIEIHYSSLDTDDMLLKDVVSLYMDEQRRFLTSEQKQFCSRMMRYMELWYGIDHEKISGKYSVMSHQGRNLYNKKGYWSLVENLLGALDCKILTSKPVKTITRKSSKNDPYHTVKTTDGSMISAEYLVVTVPHSVLALEEMHDYGIQWVPRLPKPMYESFQSIHFGSLGKVVLEFDHVWWEISQDRIVVLANDLSKSDKSKNDLPSSDLSDTIPKPFDYPIYVVNYARIHPGKDSLVVLTQSPVTEFLEANPQLAWSYLRPMLQKLLHNVPTNLGPCSIPDPINTFVTDWTQNPYIRGSYCALHVGDDPIDEIVQLSGEHDVCGLGSTSTVRFAGEHTASDGAGCVHGAYDSGDRSAKWIINHSKQEL